MAQMRVMHIMLSSHGQSLSKATVRERRKSDNSSTVNVVAPNFMKKNER
jgi:hypothetical protein